MVDIVRDVNRKKCTLFGRNKELSDIVLQHPSISRQHCAIVHGSSGNMYCVDLGSSHGSSVNKKRLVGEKREVLRDGDIIRFGASTREYVVRLRLDSDDEESEDDRKSRKRKRRSSEREKTKKTKKNKKSQEADGDSEEKVSCRHILVKHKDSRRPHSWKSENITRTKEEALEIIQKFRTELLESDSLQDSFIELAKKESDCNSNKRGGDLGKFGRGKMQKPFEEAAFALKVGDLSEPVSTQSGVHLIYAYAQHK